MPRLAPMSSGLACAALAVVAVSAPPELDSGPVDQLIYNHGGANATNRSVADVLRERVSVRDFGALGACGSPDAQPNLPTEANCPDDTAAFNAAFSWAAEPYNQITVHVPPGSYRIDGTVELRSSELILERGAVLRRVNITANDRPMVRLGFGARLTGAGALTSMNPSPRGIVNIGPTNLSQYENVEYAHVSGVLIQGPGTSWSIMHPEAPVNKHIEGSKGMCLDSSEGFARTHMCKYVPDLPGCINETIGGGACYQNSVRDITVSDIDVGVYLGPEVNGNSVSNVMMIGMGQASYFIDGPNSENTVAGGFTAGFGGNLTVIKARSSAYNYFMSVQSEPGQNSTYFDFDEHSLWNTVIGQDGTFDESYECPTIQPGGNPSQCAGPTTRDPRFIYMQHGQLHIGDFNSSVGQTGAPAPKLDWRYQLQVEGQGYIRTLSHGYPLRKHAGVATERVESVEDAPVLLTSTATHTLSISNLTMLANDAASDSTTPAGAQAFQGFRAGAFFEVSIQGAGVGGRDCSRVGAICVLSTKFMVVPVRIGASAQLHVRRMVATDADDDGAATVALLGGRSIWEGDEVKFALAQAEHRELVVEVRRGGRPCTAPLIALV